MRDSPKLKKEEECRVLEEKEKRLQELKKKKEKHERIFSQWYDLLCQSNITIEEFCHYIQKRKREELDKNHPNKNNENNNNNNNSNNNSVDSTNDEYNNNPLSYSFQ